MCGSLEKKRVMLLLTTTPWNDRRQYIRQAPSLAAAGFNVIYAAHFPDGTATPSLFQNVPISAKERRLSRLMGGMNLLIKIMKQKPDVVQLCSVEQLPLGLALKLLSRTKIVYDCREDMVSSLRQHRDNIPWLGRIMLSMAVQFLENMAARFLDGIITADPFVYQKHKLMPKDRKLIFYNAPQLRDFKKAYDGLKDRHYDLVVMGSMSARTGVYDVVNALGKLKASGMVLSLLLLGEPDRQTRKRIFAIAKELKLENQIRITGWIDHQEVPHVLSTAKIGLVPLLDYKKFQNNIACKTFEYMACGMPCVCSDLRPQRLFLTEGVNAFFYEPGNVDELVGCIMQLIENPLLMQSMGDRNRQLVETHWNAEKFESELVAYYKSNILGLR